jgi:hypothetical protein
MVDKLLLKTKLGFNFPFIFSVAPKARSRRMRRFDFARCASYAQRERMSFKLRYYLGN